MFPGVSEFLIVTEQLFQCWQVVFYKTVLLSTKSLIRSVENDDLPAIVRHNSVHVLWMAGGERLTFETDRRAEKSRQASLNTGTAGWLLSTGQSLGLSCSF